jgi:hypothetical protein
VNAKRFYAQPLKGDELASTWSQYNGKEPVLHTEGSYTEDSGDNQRTQDDPSEHIKVLPEGYRFAIIHPF